MIELHTNVICAICLRMILECPAIRVRLALQKLGIKLE